MRPAEAKRHGHRRLLAGVAVLALAGVAGFVAQTIDERGDLKPPPAMSVRAHVGLTANDGCQRGPCHY